MKQCILALIIVLFFGGTANSDFDLDTVLSHRPRTKGLIHDYVGVMKNVKESSNAYLKNIRNRYGIEILIVTLPGLSGKRTVNETAAELFSNWKIGKDVHGRGILVLLVDDVKEVKLEVGFDLEDVFTDLFTGYIEDQQLQPYYNAGELAIGVIAMLEELEARAQVEQKGLYSLSEISRLDAPYLSQGAGARQALEKNTRQLEFSGEVNQRYPAGQTPEDAWLIMIQAWQDRVRDPYLGVYTAVARLGFRDYTTVSDAYLKDQYKTYAFKSYRILQNGPYAVVSFGKKDGWDNAPFLLCRTPAGWQFDLVHQRRFIRMGKAPHWGVEFSEYPYMELLMDSFQFHGQDIPLSEQDRYTIDRDIEYANRILQYEALFREDPKNFDTALELGRLYAITAMGRKGIKILNTAAALCPDDPRPYKYLAVAHVDAHYQYDTALKVLNRYVQLTPKDSFGYKFKGYLHYRKKDYRKAADAFEKALSLNPDDCYAHFYLAYTYAGLYEEAMKLNPRRKTYKERFYDHVDRTRSFFEAHPLRVQKLNQWLGE
jgi:tetratricopeptide (TPR) repeat protein